MLENIKPSKWLNKFVCYFSGRFYRLDNKLGFEANDASQHIIVVAKSYYTEQWQSFPAISKSELKKILELNLSVNGKASIQRVYKNSEIDGFDVKTISFNNDLLKLIGNGKLLIPETELIAKFLLTNDVVALEVESPRGKLFISENQNRVTSALHGGLLNSLTKYKLSAGVSDTAESKKLSIEAYANTLLNCFNSTSPQELLQISYFDVKSLFTKKQLHLLYWAPIATASVFTLGTLVFSQLQLSSLESELKNHGDLVGNLLNTQNQIQQNFELAGAIGAELQLTQNFYEYWDIVYHLVEEGMFVQQFIKRDEFYRIRGKADDASKILERLSKIKNVENASFEGVVRKSRGQDAFVLQFNIEKGVS